VRLSLRLRDNANTKQQVKLQISIFPCLRFERCNPKTEDSGLKGNVQDTAIEQSIPNQAGVIISDIRTFYIFQFTGFLKKSKNVQTFPIFANSYIGMCTLKSRLFQSLLERKKLALYLMMN
jgi:hypothetical protein